MYTHKTEYRTYLHLNGEVSKTDCLLILEKILAVKEVGDGNFNVYVDGVSEPVTITRKQFNILIDKIWSKK